MLTTRISVVVIIMLGLFLLVAAYDHPHHHASAGSSEGFPAADRRHTSAGVVGDNKDLEKLILWRRNMVATGRHISPSSPHNYRRHLRRLLGTTSSEREDRPPSPATKNSGLDGTGDDVTKMKEVIRRSGGKHNDDQYGAVPSGCRRWRRLIAAVPSDSQPSPGYHRL